jgi:hypothetical protein
VQHIFYTSLAFSPQSIAGVMMAHKRTEKYLKDVAARAGVKVTVVKRGAV